MGFDDAGHLRRGQRADLVAVSLNSVRTTGGGASPETVVFAASAADVTDVIISGRRIVSQGSHSWIGDVAADLGRAIDALLGTPRSEGSA